MIGSYTIDSRTKKVVTTNIVKKALPQPRIDAFKTNKLRYVVDDIILLTWATTKASEEFLNGKKEEKNNIIKLREKKDVQEFTLTAVNAQGEKVSWSISITVAEKGIGTPLTKDPFLIRIFKI